MALLVSLAGPGCGGARDAEATEQERLVEGANRMFRRAMFEALWRQQANARRDFARCVDVADRCDARVRLCERGRRRQRIDIADRDASLTGCSTSLEDTHRALLGTQWEHAQTQVALDNTNGALHEREEALARTERELENVRHAFEQAQAELALEREARRQEAGERARCEREVADAQRDERAAEQRASACSAASRMAGLSAQSVAPL